MQGNHRVALVQMSSSPRVADNLANAAELIARAVSSGAGTVLLPEAFAFIGPDAEKRRILEPLDDPTADTPILDWCTQTAKLHAIDLIVGGFHEASPDPARSFNTCLHLTGDGVIQARYRKIHLFDVALKDGTVLQESSRTLPGDRPVTTDTGFGRLGLSICYDLRFPYHYQQLVDAGAIALSVPSAFTATTGAAHWHVLLRARAIECQCYVLAPAQHGHHHDRRYSYGHSLIIDPWGDIIAEQANGDAVVIADIDPSRVSQVREELPSLQHRRRLE